MSGKAQTARFAPNEDPDSMLFPDEGEREILESLEGASVQVWCCARDRVVWH